MLQLRLRGTDTATGLSVCQWLGKTKLSKKLGAYIEATQAIEVILTTATFEQFLRRLLSKQGSKPYSQ